MVLDSLSTSVLCAGERSIWASHVSHFWARIHIWTHTRAHTSAQHSINMQWLQWRTLPSHPAKNSTTEAMKEESVTMSCVSFGDDESAGHTRAACERKAIKRHLWIVWFGWRHLSVQLLSQSSCMLACVFMQPIHMWRRGSGSLMNYGEQTRDKGRARNTALLKWKRKKRNVGYAALPSVRRVVHLLQAEAQIRRPLTPDISVGLAIVAFTGSWNRLISAALISAWIHGRLRLLLL